MGEVSTHSHGSMTSGGGALQYKGVLKCPGRGGGGGGGGEEAYHILHVCTLFPLTVSLKCMHTHTHHQHTSPAHTIHITSTHNIPPGRNEYNRRTSAHTLLPLLDQHQRCLITYECN